MMKYLVLLLVFLSPALAFAGAPADIYNANAHYMAGLGLGLIVLEFILPTKGILGLVGLALFIPGTFVFADHANPDLRMSWPMIIAMDVLVVLIVALTAVITYRGYTRKNLESIDTLINSRATVIEWDGHAGRVSVQGTTWNATCITHLPLDTGDTVIITGHHNLTLTVTKETL